MRRADSDLFVSVLAGHSFRYLNNLPPRLAIKEMQMQFATNEGAFQADSATMCFNYLASGATAQVGMMSTLCEKFCEGQLELQHQIVLVDMGPLNLFVVSSALQSMIFQTQQLFGHDIEMTPVRHALRNWIKVWNLYQDGYCYLYRHVPLVGHSLTSDNMWKRLGFLRYAPEYWQLAQFLVERISTASATREQALADRAAASTTCQQSPPSLLKQYDDTSMRQVNDLIVEFQQVWR